MKHKLVFALVVLSSMSAHTRTIELTLYPAEASDPPARRYTLLPKAEKQSEEDAVPLYEKAVKLMPLTMRLCSGNDPAQIEGEIWQHSGITH